MRLLVLACAALAGCGAPARRTPDADARGPGQRSPGAAARVDAAPVMARIAADSPVAFCRDALARSAPADCVRVRPSAQGSPIELGEVRWLRARALVATNAAPAALIELDALATSDHPLAPWAALESVRIAQAITPASSSAPAPPAPSTTTNLPAAAPEAPAPLDDANRARMERLEHLPRGFAGQWDADVLRARFVLAQSDRAAARTALERVLQDARRGAEANAVRLEYARLLTESGAPADLLAALRVYRTVATTSPETAAGREALAAAGRALTALPEADRATVRELSPEERLVLAESWMRVLEYEKAEAEADLVARDPRASASQHCDALLLEGKAILRRRERERGVEHMRRVANTCRQAELLAPALYERGRALTNLGRVDEAIADFDALVARAPAHRLADDAAYLAAVAAASKGQESDAKDRLERMLRTFPSGDMRADARFNLVWLARKRSAWPHALRELEALLGGDAQESAEDIRGRAAYWRARTLLDAGRREEALRGWETLAESYPLSYYAQQAVARIGELDGASAVRIVATWRDQDDGAPLAVSPRAETRTPGFLRALSLLHVGELARARRELDALGLFDTSVRDDVRWAVSAVLAQNGAFTDAIRIVRTGLRQSLMQRPPVSDDRKRWRIAYPLAYAEDVSAASNAAGIPAAFLSAVAREESSFDANAVSTSHAYGLVQVILPTAQRFAQAAGATATPATLVDPAVNLAIGARYIAFLRARYAANPSVVPAAYNAGEGAVDGWLQENAGLPLDAWIESIPYEETRRYTRRVLQSYGIYAFLETGELPPLPASLPTPS